MKGILKWISHNRFTVIVPIVMLVFWVIMLGCSARTESPTHQGSFVSSDGLATEYRIWKLSQERMQILFESAGADLERQKEQQTKFYEFLLSLASGAVTTWPALIKLMVGGGLFAAIGDNIRKGVVIKTYKNGTRNNGN